MAAIWAATVAITGSPLSGTPFQIGCRLRVRLEFGCLEEDACCFAVTFRAGEKVSAGGVKCGEWPAVGGKGGK